jgi:hypothetical protein
MKAKQKNLCTRSLEPLTVITHSIENHFVKNHFDKNLKVDWKFLDSSLYQNFPLDQLERQKN